MVKWGGSFVVIAAVVAVIVVVLGGGGSSEPRARSQFPDAASTGIPAGTTLTKPKLDADRNYVVTTNNAVVDAVDVSGCIDVRATGVTIKDSRAACMTTSQSPAAENPANPRLTIQDSEVVCNASSPGKTGILWRNITVLRTDISGCENGLDMTSDFTLEESYVHALTQCAKPGCPEPDAHTDGIQSSNGTNVTIEHNTIEGWTRPCTYPSDGTCNGTSAININANPGGPTTTNLLIKDNLLSGGANALYCPASATADAQIVDNHFSTVYSPKVGEYAPSSNCASDETVSGNVYHESGKPVTLR
jgi:hypothetical protein